MSIRNVIVIKHGLPVFCESSCMGGQALTKARPAGPRPAEGRNQCLPTHALTSQNTAINV